MRTPLLSAELEAAVKPLQNKRNAGRDNIIAELFKYGTDNITKELQQFIMKLKELENTQMKSVKA